uniref:Putative LAGLIDADG homing endonuclease n=1 Tax=Gloeotilopsis planctonica TaxID=34157 RepID=A0A1B2RZ86_9CHLO|nr:putative LAGLIDADG homing endonuclease [Gloeotilopsis planctonica]
MFQINECESLETLRKAPCFSLDDFYNYGHAKHVPRISENFLEWFIGFFEGDGYLGFRTVVTYDRLYFSICQKEKFIIEKIAYTFGFGSVSSFKNKKNGPIYWRWSLDSKSSIESIAFLLSGNLILKSRQKQFLNWVEVGQKKGMFKPPFNKNKPWLAQLSLNNAWLSGFIDAEGCFYANFQMSSLVLKKLNFQNQNSFNLNQFCELKPHLWQKMTLTQCTSPENLLVFKEILNLFKSSSSIHCFKNKLKTNEYSKNQYIRIEFKCLKSQDLIVNYLSKYKLKTIKYISYRRWWRIYLRRKTKLHLSPQGIKRLYRLVKAVNLHKKEVYIKNYQ